MDARIATMESRLMSRFRLKLDEAQVWVEDILRELPDLSARELDDAASWVRRKTPRDEYITSKHITDRIVDDRARRKWQGLERRRDPDQKLFKRPLPARGAACIRAAFRAGKEMPHASEEELGRRIRELVEEEG